ncbi:fungal-specific transcription factor domain-containing protein [Aspergillus spectabilis]
MPLPHKSYRRPRRPPAHLRTKTGCLTCRRRRKKCDERRDTCENCARRWLTCIWPSPTATAASDDIQPDFSMPMLSPSPAGSPSIESIGIRVADTKRGLSNVTHEPTTVPSYAGVIPLASGSIFDLLRTKWLRQLIRPLASGLLIESYHQESMAMAMSTPFYMHSLLACCGAEYPVDDVNAREHFWRLSRKHYVRAITGLREALRASEPKLHRQAILRTVLMLCIFERSKPWPSSGVGAHLSGLAQLIQSESAWGSSDYPVPASSGAMIRRVMLEAFIFHATTSIPFQPFADQQSNLNVAMRLAESKLEGMFSEGTPAYPDSPVLGVPPKLFVLIREISLMHREHELSHVDYNRHLQLWQSLNSMGEQLSRHRYLYSAGAYCLESTTMENETPPLSAPWVTTCGSDPFLIGPKLYIIAANILLANMLKDARDHFTRTIPELVRDGVQLVSQLQPPKDYYAEYYGWPIYVLAKFVSCKQDQNCLLSQVNAFWKATRSGTMARLADMLVALG